MREISRFQKNTQNAIEALRSQKRVSPDGFGAAVYEKFRESRQEPIRLAAALTGYFEERGVTEVERKEFENYLRIHIRNAMEALVEEDSPEKMEALAAQGWFAERQLNEFIKTARERQKKQALIWLMRYKDREYGYSRRSYPL